MIDKIENLICGLIILFTFIICFFYFFDIFFAKNFWWIIIVFCYLGFFLVDDFFVKREILNESLKVREVTETRIDFWN